MTMEVVYVTVGTTKFDSLIEAITSDAALSALKERGCKKLVLQIGNGTPVAAETIKNQYQIEVKQYDFKFEPTRTDIVRADVTIGHAGAGTCMDIIHLGKHGLLVTNDELMGNHQIELAEQMAEEGYIYHCSIKQLSECIRTLDFNALKPYGHSNNMKHFINSLNKLMS